MSGRYVAFIPAHATLAAGELLHVTNAEIAATLLVFVALIHFKQ